VLARVDEGAQRVRNKEWGVGVGYVKTRRRGQKEGIK